jgi:hypothetical protein
VSATIADLVAGEESRRNAIADVSNGKVLDWILEILSKGGPNARSEAGRAAGALLSDDTSCRKLLARPNSVPGILSALRADGLGAVTTSSLASAVSLLTLQNQRLTPAHPLYGVSCTVEGVNAAVGSFRESEGGRMRDAEHVFASWALAAWAESKEGK